MGSTFMAVLPVHIVHTQGKRVHLGFLFEIKKVAQDLKRRVLYYDFETMSFNWGELPLTSNWTHKDAMTARTRLPERIARGDRIAIQEGANVIMSLDMSSDSMLTVEC